MKAFFIDYSVCDRAKSKPGLMGNTLVGSKNERCHDASYSLDKYRLLACFLLLVQQSSVLDRARIRYCRENTTSCFICYFAQLTEKKS